MRKFKKAVFIKVHTLLAVFILPVVIMFFVTGVLYTWGVKGEYNITVYELQLEKPIKGQLVELVNLAEKELNIRNLTVPTGKAVVKTIGNSFKLEWSGATMDVIIQPTLQPLIAQLEIKNTSWYRQFVQLHKAKGGTFFKVYATVFTIALLLILITGFIMAWKMPKLRKLTLISLVSGIVTFVVMVIYS